MEKLLYLSREDVEKAGPTMSGVLSAMETAFHEKGEGRVEMPPKLGIHPGESDNFIHAMPASVPALDSAGIKWISGFPENQRRNLPYINGLLILNSTETGLPLAVMDAVWLTGMRTGAATALSARHLARPDASVLGMLGCGVQGRTNLTALNVIFPLREIRAYDVDKEAAARYVKDAADTHGLKTIAVESPREAVTGCDMVVTAGPILKIPHATIPAGWLDPGTFVSMVDYDSYFSREALAEADKFCTDDTAQLRTAAKQGYFQNIPPVHADLGELITGRRPGRQSREEITMAANLGLALSDMAVAPLIYRRALEMGVGVELAL